MLLFIGCCSIDASPSQHGHTKSHRPADGKLTETTTTTTEKRNKGLQQEACTKQS
jgi:hypothetical protein